MLAKRMIGDERQSIFFVGYADPDSPAGRLKKAKQGDKEAKAQFDVMSAVLPLLREGKPARTVKLTDEQRPVFEMLQLLTAKPIVYVANVDEGSAADDPFGVAMGAAAERGEGVEGADGFAWQMPP